MSDTARPPRYIVVVDIGKTNAKVVLHDLELKRDLAIRSTGNEVVTDGPYAHFDVPRLERFILESLRELGTEHPIDAISITTHGASTALVGADDLVLPVLDYEFDLSGPETDEYEELRPEFSETFSPRMANGLNLGNQIFWLQRRFPEEFAGVRHILTYPQFWAWRLTGVAAFEPTSVGCHTDLWAPERGDFSSLVDRLGWRMLFAPRRSAFEILGPLKPDLARAAGLEKNGPIPVHCGIHDSNASLLPHLLARPAPFTVISTGTWVVNFAIGGRTDRLDPAAGTLANVDVFGRPIPSSLFMGGREFDILTDRRPEEPDEATIERVLSRGIMALPGLTPGTGPFPQTQGGWTERVETLSAAERTAAASLYAALMIDTVLRLIGADGPTIVEGPFARNDLVTRTLAQLTGRDVIAPTAGTGTSAGAALLALGSPASADQALSADAAAPLPARSMPGLLDYAARWRARTNLVPAPQTS